MQIKSVGFGRFIATNGYDTAEFQTVRKKRESPNQPPIPAHWSARYEQRTITIPGNKDDALAFAEKLLTCPQTSKITLTDITHNQLIDRNVHGIIAMTLQEFMEHTDDILPYMADKLTTLTLDNVQYAIVGCDPEKQVVHVRVWGVARIPNLMQPSVMYHITKRKNIPSIRQQGLRPRLGQRAKARHETAPGIFLFPSIQDLEDNMAEMTAMFRPDDELVILEIQIDQTLMGYMRQFVSHEIICQAVIPPDRISVMNQDFQFIMM